MSPSHARGKDSDENNSDDKDHDLLVVAHPAHNLSKIVTVHGKNNGLKNDCY